MARSSKCTTCRYEFVDEIETLYEEVGRNITRLSEKIQERFADADDEIPGYSSLRRHFKGDHYDKDLAGLDASDQDTDGDISDQEMALINMQIETQGITNLSMEDIVKNTKYNKKKSKESAERLRELLPQIDIVYETAETDKIRLDCLKMKREITMSINKLETDYIQTELKTKEVMQKAKDEEGSKKDTIFEEDFQKAMIIFSRRIKDNMFIIEEEQEDGDELPNIAALE